jgi:hypothetical protein
MIVELGLRPASPVTQRGLGIKVLLMPRLQFTDEKDAGILKPAYLVLVQLLVDVCRQHVGVVVNALLWRLAR